MPRLILLRGNSGSGKTTVARALQRRFGQNTMLISQDAVRRDMLRAKDGENTPALPLLTALLEYGAAHSGTTILEGILRADWYRPLLVRAAELYGRAAADGLLLDGARLETAVLALLRMQDPADFAQVRGVSEGLENRLTAAVREADSLDDLYTRLKTKRYPHARLRRLVLDAALGFPEELPMPPYLHVLGARKAALPRLKQASLPAATALADLARTGPEAAKISRLHNKAVDFSSLCREKIQPMGLAFTAKPVVI